jgi:hypothetical protein
MVNIHEEYATPRYSSVDVTTMVPRTVSTPVQYTQNVTT